jgi:hypothetical protein
MTAGLGAGEAAARTAVALAILLALARAMASFLAAAKAAAPSSRGGGGRDAAMTRALEAIPPPNPPRPPQVEVAPCRPRKPSTNVLNFIAGDVESSRFVGVMPEGGTSVVVGLGESVDGRKRLSGAKRVTEAGLRLW